jgi:hypothetical protein
MNAKQSDDINEEERLINALDVYEMALKTTKNQIFLVAKKFIIKWKLYFKRFSWTM